MCYVVSMNCIKFNCFSTVAIFIQKLRTDKHLIICPQTFSLLLFAKIFSCDVYLCNSFYSIKAKKICCQGMFCKNTCINNL